jgi:hypothetical protein
MPITPVTVPAWATQIIDHHSQKSHCNKSREEEDEMTAAALPAKEGFTFGCDPELFVKNEAGVYVSAAGLIPGTKEAPFKVNKGAVQVDGMAAEFNIDPVTTFAEFNSSIEAVMAELQRMLPEGYTLDAIPAVTFDKSMFDEAPDEAKLLGCSPDHDAWTGKVNPPPNDPDNPYLRTCSGHLHIGWGEGYDLTDVQHILNCRDLAKQFDWYLGGWSLTKDKDNTRRKLYGKAGAIRFKPYGVEYRVLSNFWIVSKSLRLAVWNRMQMAINAMSTNFVPERVDAANSVMLCESINTGVLTPTLKESFRYPLLTTDTRYCRY